MSTLRPFRARVADADLTDLAAPLARARLAPEPAGAGADAVPMPTAPVTGLLRHWREEFDRRGVEARLDDHDQYLTEIDGATRRRCTSCTRRRPSPAPSRWS